MIFNEFDFFIAALLVLTVNAAGDQPEPSGNTIPTVVFILLQIQECGQEADRRDSKKN
jgi:hypothetical protein